MAIEEAFEGMGQNLRSAGNSRAQEALDGGAALAEVVNMQPPEALIRAGVESLPCLGDGRQSGTSGSPSILNAAPEAATGGALALLEDGDRLRVDLGRCEVRLLIDDAELEARRRRLEVGGGYRYPAHQTPWQEIQRGLVEPLDRGMILSTATQYRDMARKSPPRDNHRGLSAPASRHPPPGHGR